MNINDSNTKSDPISGATPMSDTKILSAEQHALYREAYNRVYEVCGGGIMAIPPAMNAGWEAVHAAQAKRIEELENNLEDMTSMWTAACAFGKKKEAAALQSAEAAEKQATDAERRAIDAEAMYKAVADKLSAIQAALPAERALEIAEVLRLASYGSAHDPTRIAALRAYAAALTGKEG